MLRITKSNKIKNIKLFTKQEVSEGTNGTEIDSFILIPGITNYNHIFIQKNWLCFDSNNDYIAVEFDSESELERYIIQLMREIKLNQITNLNIDLDKK
jgi:hypothetical protein